MELSLKNTDNKFDEALYFCLIDQLLNPEEQKLNIAVKGKTYIQEG